jgi:hypothetical protein
VHVAQPSATYVHSVRCSERHRSERLLVRLFVLACACVCVCVCCSVLVLQCARVFARLHVAVRKLRARVVLRAVQCICMRNCVNELCTSLLFASNASSNALLVCVFASFFFHVCAQWQTNNSTQAGVAHCKRVLLYSTAARVTVRMGKRVQHALLLTAELLKPSAPSCTRAHR